MRGAAATLAAGDVLVVMQMQDAVFDTGGSGGGGTPDYGDGPGGLTGAGYTALNNTGLYEYVVAQGGLFTGGTCPAGSSCVTVRGAGAGDGLLFTYTTAARVDTGGSRRGQRTFQVVRVARYASGILSGTLAAAPWDGRTGGVLAVDVAGALSLGGAAVSVDGMGFRGGVGQSLGGASGVSNADYRVTTGTTAHGRKGEGIACTPDVFTEVPGGTGSDGCPRGDRARGAPGNAGGGGTDGNPAANDQNSGGGGGGNGGAGGVGGNSWSSNLAVGGRGGAPVPMANGRLVLGGGGGAGTSNNAGPGHGTAGGGIVMVRAGSVTGTGTLTARGPDAACSAQDAAGGGGAGGSVLVYAESGALAGLTVLAGGGRGGDANIGACAVSGGAHGPGAGGGGGVVFASGAVSGASSVAGGSNGLTTGNVAFGAQPGAGGPAIDATLTAAEIPGVQACTLATRATLAGLRVGPGLVEFATATQRGTLGFNVYAAGDGRTRGGRLNERLVRAPLSHSVTPILYRAEVRPSDAPYVVIEEIERHGRRRLLGPFPREDEGLRRSLERLEALAETLAVRATASGRLLLGRPGARAAAPAARVARAGRTTGALKVEVPGAGTVSLPLAELQAAGLPPGAPAVWSMGKPVAHRVLWDRGRAVLQFEAAALSTDYTGRNVYVITAGASPAPPPPAVAWTRSGPALPDGFTRVGEPVLYAPFIHRDADPWIRDYLVSDVESAPLVFDLPGLPAGGAEAVPVRIHLAGGSWQRHEVEAVLNGVALPRARWRGQEPAVLGGLVPRAALRAAGNELQLRYGAWPVTEADAGLAFVGAVDVGVVLPPAGVVEPDRIAPYDPSLPSLAGVDYLIVTHADFAAEAERLAGLKRAQGLSPLVVDVERAYDRHAGGVFEASAVRALLQEYARAGSARYVVLLGDDSYDPRGFQGLAARAFVPSLMGWDGLFGRVPSENLYADVDGDSLPELAIGRLPASTPAEAAVMLDKAEAGPEPAGAALDAGHLVAVDDQGPDDPPFSRIAGQVRSWWRGPITVADAGRGFAAARQALLAGLARGPRTLHFFGHGGPQTWTDEGLLVPEDLPPLAGGGGRTVLFAWTCQAQWYQDALGPSINESLLLLPQGGVAAAFGPAGISDPHLQKALAALVYKGLSAGLPLGEAVRDAKRAALQANPALAPVVDGWHLLGDPALSLSSPAVPAAGNVRGTRFRVTLGANNR